MGVPFHYCMRGKWGEVWEQGKLRSLVPRLSPYWSPVSLLYERKVGRSLGTRQVKKPRSQAQSLLESRLYERKVGEVWEQGKLRSLVPRLSPCGSPVSLLYERKVWEQGKLRSLVPRLSPCGSPVSLLYERKVGRSLGTRQVKKPRSQAQSLWESRFITV